MALNLNEVASLTLQLNNGDASKSIDQLNTKAKELQTTIKAIEKDGGKGSENWQKYKNELNDVQKATSQLKKEVDVTTLTYGQLDNLVKQLNKDLKGMKPGTDEFNAAAKRLGEAEKQFKAVKKEVNDVKEGAEDLAKPTLWQKIVSGVTSVEKAAKAFIALEVISFIIDIGKSIFETSSKFEKYGKVLETALGSQKEAKSAMEALKDLGSKTAFSVDELTEGYVKMVNRGLRPSQKEMVAMTDLAASQGKTFDDLVEAALDAQTGEFERLKEFGIKASKEGDNVTLSFKGMNQVVKNTPEAIQGAINAFGTMTGVAGQNAKMMETLEGQASNLGDNFDSLKVEMGEKLRPVFVAVLQVMSGGITVVRGLVSVVSTLVTGVVAYYKTLWDFSVGAGGVMKSMGTAIGLFLSGNFEAAGKAWDQTKAAGAAVINQVKVNAKAGADSIVAIWSDPAATVKAEFAGKSQGKAHGEGMTDEQKKALKEQEKQAEQARKKEEADHKKHLEDVNKANQKALEDLAKLETESHIASIKDEMQREFAKLQAKRDLEAEEITRGLQSQTIKNQQIANLDKKLEEDVARVAGEFAEKKRKKSEEESLKRLEAEKGIIEQQRLAESALLDFQELQAKGNATKLAAIHQERLTSQFNATKAKLDAEEVAEVAKANKDLAGTDQLDAALTAIHSRYGNEQKLNEAKNAAEIEKINKDLQDKKKQQWTDASGAFSSLLKGDLAGFVEHTNKIFTGEQQGWQKRLQQNTEKYEAVGQMASQAAQFLAGLAQQQAEKEIAEAKRVRDEKVALLNDELETTKNGIQQTEESIKATKTESADKIKSLKADETKTVKDMETLYSNLSNAEGQADLQAEITRTTTAKTEKIAAATEAKENAIEAATEEKEEKINAAEATRDAEMASINKRTDLDSKTRAKMIEESKARAALEIKQANTDFDTKTKLSKEEAAAKIKDATEEAEKKTKLLEALKTADKDKAKELIAVAKDEAAQKVKTAEQEKAAKLKLLEQEKATRIQNKKDLEAAIAAEDKRAKAVEAAAKQKAWKAQQNADVASAIITGSLATLKALASGFWPVNLVFAAATAVMTGIQVAMIKRQPMPSFAHGGYIAEGGRHGSSYGAGGIGLVDRQTGREVGEMEGDEAIISREQTKANLPLIKRMFANARTPGKRSAPVDYRAPAYRGTAFREGGLLDPERWSGRMYQYGGRVKRMYEEGGLSSYDTTDGEGPLGGAAAADQAQQKAIEQGEQQLKRLDQILEQLKAGNTDQKQAMQNLSFNISWSLNSLDGNMRTSMQNLATSMSGSVNQMGQQVAGLKGAINGVQGAVNQNTGATQVVERAVYNTNANGTLGGLIGLISFFGSKK